MDRENIYIYIYITVTIIFNTIKIRPSSMLLRRFLNNVIYIEFLGFRRNKSLENCQG